MKIYKLIIPVTILAVVSLLVTFIHVNTVQGERLNPTEYGLLYQDLDKYYVLRQDDQAAETGSDVNLIEDIFVTNDIIYNLEDYNYSLELEKGNLFHQGILSPTDESIIYLERSNVPYEYSVYLYNLNYKDKERILHNDMFSKEGKFVKPIAWSGNTNTIVMGSFNPDSLYNELIYDLIFYDIESHKYDLVSIENPISNLYLDPDQKNIYFNEVVEDYKSDHTYAYVNITKLDLASRSQSIIQTGNKKIYGWIAGRENELLKQGMFMSNNSTVFHPALNEGLLLPFPDDQTRCVNRTWIGAPSLPEGNTATPAPTPPGAQGTCLTGFDPHSDNYKVDFSGDGGDPVMASHWGIVRHSYESGGYGNYIKLENNNENIRTVYAHLSSYVVNNNEDVDRGEKVGLVGSTGAAFGDHLHFEFQNLSGSQRLLPVFEETQWTIVAEYKYKSVNYQCYPPLNGDWIIDKSCLYRGNHTANGKVKVTNDSLLKIESEATLDIDFINDKLIIFPNSNIKIKPNGRIK